MNELELLCETLWKHREDTFLDSKKGKMGREALIRIQERIEMNPGFEVNQKYHAYLLYTRLRLDGIPPEKATRYSRVPSITRYHNERHYKSTLGTKK